MKKIVLAIFGVLVLGCAAFFLYVSMIDWNLHKDKIASQFSNVTGKKVVFSGPVSFNVFPSPYLTASNVKIYNETADMTLPPLATVKELVAELSLFPLLHGNFDVKKMSLIEPEMMIEVLPEGKINWQSSLPVDYDKPKEKIEVSLDSVMIEKAKLNIVSKEFGVNLSLDNLNAEVIADSVFGPYRIEGSYVNDNNPEGFALSLGQLSDSFATSLNFVVRHPKSDSYLRFDGSFFLKNSAVNGSVVVESARLVDFVNSYFPHLTIDKRYEFPLAMSMELTTNRTKIDVSNFVVKYGSTVGAGNILIPLKADEFNVKDVEEVERKKVEVSFNMTDLDLNPFVWALTDYYKAHKDYKLDLGYDLLADIKSVKTTYKDEGIRDFALSFDILEKNINVQTLGGILPGETTLTSQGTILSEDEKLTYNFDITANGLDFLKLSSWLGYKIPVVNNSTYKSFEIVTGISGNHDVTKISPLEFRIDKTKLRGEAGIIWGDRISILTNLNIDSINLDNYFNKIPAEVSAKGVSEELKYVFSHFDLLNTYDLKVSSSIGLIIYNSVPFENIELAFATDKGAMTLEKLNITSVKNSGMDFSGNLSGFGNNKLTFSNLKYNILTQDFYSLFPKSVLPNFMKETKDFKKLEAKGIVTGNLDKMATKSIFKLNEINSVYSGELSKGVTGYVLSGKIDLRAPDFLKFVNSFGANYSPDVISLGVLRLNADILGNDDKMSFKNMDLYVGTNKFSGALDYSKLETINDFTFDLNVNRFEIERFFYNKVAQSEAESKFVIDGQTQQEFLSKPNWSAVSYDFSPFKDFNLNGKLSFGTLSYNYEEISNAKLSVLLKNQVLLLQNISGKYKEGDVSSNQIELSMFGNTSLQGDIKLKNIPVDPKYFSGTKYGLTQGALGADITFNTVAKSQFEMMSNLNSIIKFDIQNPMVKGWSFNSISDDLSERQKSEGLVVFLTEYLQAGQTKFSQFAGQVTIEKSAFRFVGTSFFEKGTSVEVMSTGNLPAWEMKSDFVANLYNTPDKFRLSYSLSGPISNPTLFVNAENIISTYDMKNKKIEDEIKAKAKEKREKQLFLIDTQRQRANGFVTEIEEKSKFILDKKEQTKNVKMAEEYNLLITQLEQEKMILNKMLQETLNPQSLEITDALPKELKDSVDLSEVKLKGIQSKIDGVYYQDSKDILNTKYNQVADKYGKNRTEVFKFRDAYVQYPTRMAVIGKVFVLDNDLKVDELKSKIESNFSQMDSINSSMEKEYIVAQSLNNLEDIKKNISKVDFSLTEMETREKEISSSITELFEYLEAMVSEQEVAYDKMVKENEIKNKIEQSKGSISTNGKVLTLVREIEEIEKSEDAVSSEGVVVLDFSKDAKKTLPEAPQKKLISREEINKILIDGKKQDSQDSSEDKKSSTGGVIIRK